MTAYCVGCEGLGTFPDLDPQTDMPASITCTDCAGSGLARDSITFNETGRSC